MHAAAVSRREFLRTAAAGAALLAAAPAAPAQAPAGKLRLGLDNFSLRAFGWKGRELVDYAAGQRLDTLFITDLPALGTLEEAGAAELRRYAADRGLELLLGSWSICPTSRTFKKDWGTAEEHLALGLKLARAVGSPVFRVILGAREDRRSPGGIRARIADTVQVLKSQEARAKDLGVKVAVENHAGDLTAAEMVSLIEAAGRDWVGVNLDTGNVTWTLEDPVASLERLGPYVLASAHRDSAVWPTEQGAKVQWTAMGEGLVDWKRFFARFAELCPHVAVNIETIGGFAVEFPYLQPGFWEAFPELPAADFARFLALTRRGQAVPPHDPNDRERQRGELERSFAYCRDVLGLGVRR
jgi:sugar phosphate isomerase/epimerase